MKQRYNFRDAQHTRYIKVDSQPETVTEVGTLNNVLGSYQLVDGVETGKFVPGILRINPVVMRKVSTLSVPMDVRSSETYNGKKYTYRLTGDVVARSLGRVTVSPWVAPWDARLEALSVAKAYEKLNSTDDNVALWLAELRETIAMLKSPLAAFRKALTSIRKNPDFSKKTVRQLANGAGGTWLEYRYGLVPLMSDIQMLLGLIQAKLKKTDIALGRHRATSRLQSETTFRKSFSSGEWFVEANFLELRKVKSTSVVYYRYEGASEFQDLLSRFGFSPHQMLSLAWELTPYSFIVDWFLNVGSWLSSLNPKPGVTVLGLCTSQKTEVTQTAMGARAQCYGYTKNWVSVPAYGTSRIEEILVRKLSTVSLTPTINTNILNIKRVLDSLSLLWQNMPRRRR